MNLIYQCCITPSAYSPGLCCGEASLSRIKDCLNLTCIHNNSQMDEQEGRYYDSDVWLYVYLHLQLGCVLFDRFVMKHSHMITNDFRKIWLYGGWMNKKEDTASWERCQHSLHACSFSGICVVSIVDREWKEPRNTRVSKK